MTPIDQVPQSGEPDMADPFLRAAEWLADNPHEFGLYTLCSPLTKPQREALDMVMHDCPCAPGDVSTEQRLLVLSFASVIAKTLNQQDTDSK